MSYRTTRERLGERAYRSRIEQQKALIRAQREQRQADEFERMLRRHDKQYIEEFNQEFPNGCDVCGEPFGLENAEVVGDDGEHLIVHVECMGDFPMA